MLHIYLRFSKYFFAVNVCDGCKVTQSVDNSYLQCEYLRSLLRQPTCRIFESENTGSRPHCDLRSHVA